MVVYKGNLEMDRMIEQQIFALEMDTLTNRLQRLQLDNKIVTLLNELWDKMNKGGCRKVEITSDEDGMEVIIGELMVPTIYFTNEKKCSCQLRCILKSALQNEHWLRAKIHQLFVSEWKSDYFSHTDGTPMTRSLSSSKRKRHYISYLQANLSIYKQCELKIKVFTNKQNLCIYKQPLKS